jgi:hypothetical protein
MVKELIKLLNFVGYNSNDGLEIGSDSRATVYEKMSGRGFKGLIETMRLHRG